MEVSRKAERNQCSKSLPNLSHPPIAVFSNWPRLGLLIKNYSSMLNCGKLWHGGKPQPCVKKVLETITALAWQVHFTSTRSVMQVMRAVFFFFFWSVKVKNIGGGGEG